MLLKKIKTAIFLVLSIGYLSCSGKPTIEFYEKSHDFGEIEHESAVTHAFTFKNSGDDTLNITKIKAG